MNFLAIVLQAMRAYPDLDALEAQGKRYLSKLIEDEVKKIKNKQYEDFFGPDYWGIGGNLL